jgi:cell division protein FtsQ
VSGFAATLARRRAALPRSLPSLTPRLKRRLVALLALSLLLAGGYHFWLRDSSLVAVDEVKISGLTTADAPRVRIALAGAARGMTTLHVDQERLERAVEGFPVVRELKVTPDFPHGLRVRVVEHVPAALAVSDAGQVAVAGDGTILRGLPVEGSLPTVAVDGILGADRLRDAEALAAAAVAGSAPAVLRRRVEEISKRSEAGLVAELSDGPELIFGTATQLRTKWAAAARVLADPEAQGASYIDLRIAGRPAAGGLPAETVTPVAPAGTAPTAPTDPATGAATTTDPATGAATTTDPGAAPATTDPTLPADPATGAVPTTPGTTPTTPPATTTEPPATTVPPTAPAPLPAGGVEGGATAPTVP